MHNTGRNVRSGAILFIYKQQFSQSVEKIRQDTGWLYNKLKVLLLQFQSHITFYKKITHEYNLHVKLTPNWYTEKLSVTFGFIIP